MATPVRAHVGKVCEAMRDAVVQLRLVWICLCIRLCDTLRHNFGVTLLVASVLAIRTLHAGSILEKFAAKCTTHDVVELLLHEFVTVLLDNLFFALTNGTLSSKPSIEWLLVSRVFHWSLLACKKVGCEVESY